MYTLDDLLRALIMKELGEVDCSYVIFTLHES